MSDFIPRRLRNVAFVVAAGLIATGVLAGWGVLEDTIATDQALAAAAPHLLQASSGFAAWTSSVVLLVASLGCLLIHAIRRHRLDDVRGRYRIWKWASLVCLLGSADCVINVHTLVAEAGGYFTGWTALRSGAVWWLFLGVPTAWIGLRALSDTRESGAAAGILAFAFTAYGAAAACFLGWIPGLDASTESVATASSGLLGHWLLFAGVLAYARHVVLDAQGLIDRSRAEERATASNETIQEEAPKQMSESARQSPATTLRIADAPATTLRSQAAIAKGQANLSEWVDGSRRERERYDADQDDDEDAGDRKSSKSERKQLRKLKARNRAA